MKMNQNFVLGVLVIIANILSTYGLYEDQTGKFDWRQQYVGHINHLLWDQSIALGKRILVATDQHVLAALHSHNGTIAWRKILEDDARGTIDAIDHQNNALVTLCGGGRYVRSWHPGTGSLFWETVTLNTTSPGSGGDVKVLSRDEVLTLTPTGMYKFNLHNGKEKWRLQLPAKDDVVFDRLVTQGSNIYAVGYLPGGHVMVVSADTEGTLLRQRSVPAAWMTENTGCQSLDGGTLVCYDETSFHLQMLNLANGQVFRPIDLEDLGLSADGQSVTLEKVQSDSRKSDLLVRIGNDHTAILRLNIDQLQVVKDLPKVSAVYTTKVEDMNILLTLQRTSKEGIILTGYDLESGGEITELSQKISFPAHHGLPIKIDAVVVKKNGRLAYKAVVRSQDESLQLVQKSGRVSWKREEALASVLSVEMVDLPVSENQAKYEDEFGAQQEDVIGMFVKRFTTQFLQLKTLLVQQLNKLQGHRYHGIQESDAIEEEEDEEGEELTRDEFNLNKMILVATAAGKIYGLRTTNGHIQWSVYLPSLTSFKSNNKDKMLLFVQRTTAHFPNPPQCVIIGKNKFTNKGFLYAFNPINGQPIDSIPATGLALDYSIKQAYMVGEMDEHFLRGVVFLDYKDQVHTFPDTFMSVASKIIPNLFMYTADISSGLMKGYQGRNQDKGITTENVWTINLQKKQQTITNVVGKRVLEQVHSQGRVLGDRSVLYKYINPNLVVVTTEGEEPTSIQQKSPNTFVNIYLLDSITGHIVFHASHKKAKGPVNVVHVENWVVYDYFNMKSRRHEIAVIELFEGKEQGNSTAFSSFTAPREPLVLRQSYIMPVHITTMDVTVTEKGITSRSLIFAMTAGKILALPKALLDPRRPVIPSQETMEEGTIPYIPELPISTEMMVNYYLTVSNIRGIHTSPAGLESTSLVFVYGLDLYYTRVTPSRMFDVLKEDFDFYFISLVLVGMFLVTFVTQKLSSRRALSRAWK